MYTIFILSLTHAFNIYMGCVKRKRAFENVQNARIQIILRMCKVSSVPLFSIHTFVVSNDSVSEQRRP